MHRDAVKPKAGAKVLFFGRLKKLFLNKLRA